MRIEVTKFIRSHGEQRLEQTELPDDCAVGYESLRRHQCRLTAENIYGNISLCVEHSEGDYDQEIVANGPGVQTMLADMIRRFDGVKFEKWLDDLRDGEIAGEQ